MKPKTLRLRLAEPDDAKRLFDWRNDPGLNAERVLEPLPEWEAHRVWMDRSLARTDRLLLLGEAVRTDEAIGLVRLDATRGGAWTLGLMVAPAFRGRGWAARLLEEAVGHLPECDLIAHTGPRDARMAALLSEAGFAARRDGPAPQGPVTTWTLSRS